MQPEAEQLLRDYLDSLPKNHQHRQAFASAWAFGDNPALADELGTLVVQGIKTATASLEQEYQPAGDEPLPKPGDLSVVLGGDDKPLCIIETTEIRILPFGQVDPQFAYDEGEGDRSLAFWRSEHTKYFGRVCQQIGCTLDDDLPVVCERFRVVYRAGDQA
jgi:uncharacterized protein YhfF